MEPDDDLDRSVASLFVLSWLEPLSTLMPRSGGGISRAPICSADRVLVPCAFSFMPRAPLVWISQMFAARLETLLLQDARGAEIVRARRRGREEQGASNQPSLELLKTSSNGSSSNPFDSRGGLAALAPPHSRLPAGSRALPSTSAPIMAYHAAENARMEAIRARDGVVRS